MKQILNAIGQFFAIIGIFIFTMIATLIFWWPIIAIGLIAVFGLFFISEVAAIVLASIIGVLFLLVFLVKLFAN